MKLETGFYIKWMGYKCSVRVSGSSVSFPAFLNCRGVEVVTRGTMQQIQNLTVGPQCRFMLPDSTEKSFALNHVVVQTDGFMAVPREDLQMVQITGKTFDIRGGAKVTDFALVLSLYLIR